MAAKKRYIVGSAIAVLVLLSAVMIFVLKSVSGAEVNAAEPNTAEANGSRQEGFRTELATDENTIIDDSITYKYEPAHK
ncbi:MAG: hypothetical protein NC251_02125 [Lachnoclostridium sp.]|nr:hypothetical protein [Lachnospira sp.]MCM1247206.1 hypothetical protein [Lachnoclostridium sp.]MCM1534573.1 hypothetical protein [Clostridium sp.]